MKKKNKEIQINNSHYQIFSESVLLSIIIYTKNEQI